MFEDAFRSPVASPEGQQGSSLLAALPGYPSRGGTPLPRPIGSGALISASASNISGGGGNSNGLDLTEELKQARREIELLKSMVWRRDVVVGIYAFVIHRPSL